MSVAEHFDVLSPYAASATRILPVEGEPEDLIDDGGGLAAAFEEVGRRPLLGVLRDPRIRGVVLADGDLTIEATRSGPGGRLVVRWGDTVVVDEAVEIPAVVAPAEAALFRPDTSTEVKDVIAALHAPRTPLFAVRDVGGRLRWFTSGLHGRGAGALELVVRVPPVDPASFGARAFREAHGVRWSYVAGDMAGGISSVELVVAMARAGLIGFFGAGGVPLGAIADAIDQVAAGAGGGAWGFNLLHNPSDPEVEEATVDLYLARGVRRASASAYMSLTPSVARYRLSGIHTAPDGRVVCPQQVFAKLSRPEVAEKFLRPAPPDLLAALVSRGHLTEEQARLAARVPIANDVTAEADSGGHTDHRPLVVLLPVIQRLRDRIVAEEGYEPGSVRVGAAGGLGTPAAVWAAFAMGADYVLTGSVNQSTREAGTSAAAKEMLAEARYHEVGTGPAPDMFEIGARVQVLSRGSMYAQRAQRLYELYRSAAGLHDIPEKERERIEKQLFKRSLDEVWEETRTYWAARDPRQLERAEREPRHKMALTFRWYLGMTSRWARMGDEDRKRDFQIWCGPAQGGFNSWAEGTPLEPIAARTVVGIARALMEGAAAHARVASARLQGGVLDSRADAVGVLQ